MVETHLVTMSVIKSFLSNKDLFTLDYLKECIIKEGGIMRVTGNYTVFSYLEHSTFLDPITFIKISKH